MAGYGYGAGIESAGQSIAAGITAAIQKQQREKELAMQADTLRRTYESQIPKDALQRWERMRGSEKMAHIKAAEVQSEVEAAKAKQTLATQEAAELRRKRIVETNASIFKQAKEAAAPPDRPFVQTLTAEQQAAAKEAGVVALPTSEKSVQYQKLPETAAGGVDLDEQGNPIFSKDKTLYRSGNKWVPITAAMSKQIALQSQGQKDLAAAEANLAAEKVRPKTFFGLAGGPRQDRLTLFEGQRQALMSQFGTPSQGAPAPAAAGPAAAPSAAPAAAPAPATAGPSPAGAPAAGRITVVSPTGQLFTLPQEQLEAAIAQGYRQQ